MTLAASAAPAPPQTRRHVVSALVVDRPGTLNRVSGLLRARSFNIESLTVASTHEAGRSRMTIAVRGDDAHLRQVLAQLERLIEVLEVHDLTAQPRLELELALVELVPPQSSEDRLAVNRVIATTGGEMLSADASAWRLRLTGTPDRIDHALDELRGHGLRNLVRAGAVAMAAGSSHAGSRQPGSPQPGSSHAGSAHASSTSTPAPTSTNGAPDA